MQVVQVWSQASCQDDNPSSEISLVEVAFCLYYSIVHTSCILSYEWNIFCKNISSCSHSFIRSTTRCFTITRSKHTYTIVDNAIFLLGFEIWLNEYFLIMSCAYQLKTDAGVWHKMCNMQTPAVAVSNVWKMKLFYKCQIQILDSTKHDSALSRGRDMYPSSIGWLA